MCDNSIRCESFSQSDCDLHQKCSCLGALRKCRSILVVLVVLFVINVDAIGIELVDNLSQARGQQSSRPSQPRTAKTHNDILTLSLKFLQKTGIGLAVAEGRVAMSPV